MRDDSQNLVIDAALPSADHYLPAKEHTDRSQRLFLNVRGASMAPSIWPGDMLLARRCGFDEITPGDIVVFSRNGRLVTHRAVGRDAFAIFTRGDAAPTADAPVTPAELIGAVETVFRKDRAFAPPRRPGRLERSCAALLRRFPLLSRIAQRFRAIVAGDVNAEQRPAPSGAYP